MSMVEAGELGLDDPVAGHLPRDLRFDTNGATIRDLLGHRSGIPDDHDAIRGTVLSDPLRVWTPADVLELVPTKRNPIGPFEHAETNYLLLSQAATAGPAASPSRHPRAPGGRAPSPS